MEQLGTPASKLRRPITSPFAGGMTLAQLERALQTTPYMTRFNPLRRRLQALRTPNSRISKGEVTISVPGGGDEVVTTLNSTPVAQSSESLVGEDLGGEDQELTVIVKADDVQEVVLKSTNTIYSPSHEDISGPKQIDGALPTRFLRTIAKRKEMRRDKRKQSKATSLLLETSLKKSFNEEKGDGNATAYSRRFGCRAEVNTPVTSLQVPGDETSDDSEESASLEQLIRTAPRISNPQALDESAATQDISLSFGPSRLVRRAVMDSENKNSDSNDELGNLDVAILDLADGGNLSQSTDGSEDTSVDHESQQGRQTGQTKKEKRLRRLPVNELYLISERVEEMSQEKVDENVQPLVEIPDDPIFQDSPDALQVIETVGRTRHERKALQKWSYGAFGKIDKRVYRFPRLHNVLPQAELKEPLEVSPSYSDGFVGPEANPTGRFMLVPKQKRVSVSMWGLTTRVGQLELVREKDYGLTDKSNANTKRRLSTGKPGKPVKHKIRSSAPVLVEAESQAGETDQVQQINEDKEGQQDNELMRELSHGDENSDSPSPQKPKVSRRVTFDERVEVDQRSKTSPLDSQAFREHAKSNERRTSSDFQVHREMAMVRLKRYHHEFDSEEDGSCLDESDQSIFSISSDDADSGEIDETSNDTDEEMGVETEDEDESEEDFDVPEYGAVDGQDNVTIISAEGDSSEGSERSNEEIDDGNKDEHWDVRIKHSKLLAARKKQESSQIYTTRITSEDASDVSEQIKANDRGEDGHNSDEEALLDEQMRDEGDATITPTEDPSQREASIVEPFQDLTGNESQIAGVDASKHGNESQPSQLSIAMSWKNTSTNPEADDVWRPRKPLSSSVMNETGEEIIDSPSPASSISRRRISTGLHIRTRRTFSSRPLALAISRPSTPPSPEVKETQNIELEIPEKQLIAVRNVSPELGALQESDGANSFENLMRDELLLYSDGDILPHFSQLSFVPDQVTEESYFYRASQSLIESFQTPRYRAKSTPGRFRPECAQEFTTPAAVQPSIRDIPSHGCGTTVPPKFSQLSYAPTPRAKNCLSSITRKASLALGTLPASMRINRAKTLTFIPPFKKVKLGIQ